MADPILGEIRLFGSGSIPSGWLPCNGAKLAIKQNQALYSVIGTAFGGDGKVTFALPDLRGRAPVGCGLFDGEAFAVGDAGGGETSTIDLRHMAAHTHMFQACSGKGSTSNVSGANFAAVETPGPQNIYATPSSPLIPIAPASVGLSGGGLPHSNMQPYLVVSFCIATVGEYPVQPTMGQQ